MLQQVVLNGDLPCSKEAAAVLAGIQLRIEETWPSEESAKILKPLNEDGKDGFPKSLTQMSTRRMCAVESEDQGDQHNNKGRLVFHPQTSLTLLKIPKNSSILRQLLSINGNKTMTTSAINLHDCVPPLYYSTKNMVKSIKEQKRRLFHSPLYESELQLKKLYIQTCKRLPCYGCQMFHVKELLRGKTKKKATRLLGIGFERIVLLDSKTLLPAKSQLTSELQQWRTGGGRSHDRLVLEFRATKWSFITPSQGSLRSISATLWEIMQDIDSYFLDETLITTREELELANRRSLMLHHGPQSSTVYKEELDRLQNLLHFPEEVALRLTEVEYNLFYQVRPVHYIRHVTVDLRHRPPSSSVQECTVQTLTKRYNEVSSWVTHIIVSQPTHEDRKAVLSCIFRVAVCCWNFGNFNTAVEILSGLKSDKLKPFWLSLSGKERLPFLDFLSSALLTPGPTKEYKEAIERALDIPHSKVIPFFGTFLRDLKTILNGMPSLLVLPNNDTQEPELVAQFQGEDHFMSRVGVGGIINMKKIEQVCQVLDDIRAFHQHAERRRKELLPTSTSEPSEAEGAPGVEDDSLYELDIDVYHAIQPLSNDHGISFLPIRSSDVDFHDLQCMHHGTTVVHWEEDGSRSSLCFLKLERSNATLTWSKTGWSALRGSNYQDYSLTTNIEELVSSGMVMKCENSDIVFNGLEEGYLELQYIKEIRLGEAAVDLATTVSRRHGLEEMDADSCCIKLIFGACLSDNRSVEFIAPPIVAQIWTRGLSQIMTLLRRQQQMCDQRIQWVKEKYLQLFFNEQACFGPTPAEAIKVFGGRKWTLESLGGSSSSMDVSLSTFKRASSFGVSTGRMRKKKTSTSLSALRDGSPKSQTSDDPGSSEVPLREKSPLTKERRAGVKSSPPLRSQSDQTTDYRVNITHQISRPPSSVSCDNINRLAFCTPVISTSALTTNYREKYQHGDVTSSSVHGALQSVTRPTITHSSQMDFLEFTELFRSFLVRMRKDLKNLFEQVSVTVRAVNEPSVSNPKQIQHGIKVEQNKMLGLLSRNTPFDYHSNNQRKKICDAIAAASIVTNCTGVDTSKVMVMGIVEFQNFLATNQGENLSHEQVAALIKRHEPDLVMRKNLWLSFEGFARYLMDKDNYAFVPEMTRPNIEDMQHPLSHYYLASSHNTYLTGHQLKGESSVDLYSQVLLTGCRCVELDCWDGDDGIPVIYHGHTLTTKIPFKSVVEAISKAAFVTSPYPIILSLENHCSLQQQTKMAHIFSSVFGDKLVNRFLFESDFWEEPQLPSPEQLQYKVLIKNKKLRAPLTPALTLKHRNKTIPGRTNSIISTASTSSLNEDDDDEYEDDDDEDDVLMDKDVIPTRASLTESFTPICEQVDKRSLVSKSASMTGRTGSVSSQEGSGKTVSPGIVSCGGTPRPRSQNDVQDFWQAEDDNVNKARKASSQIAPELSDLVIYCQANKFRGFAGAASPTGSVKMRKMTSKKNVLATSSAPVPSTPPPPQTEIKSDSSARRPNISASCYQVSSLNENTAKRLCKRHPLALIAHCENQLMRTYPAAMRIDSSNFNPVIFWAFGLQMVALNYQTEDSALHVNTAMFEQNGHCGYVLKPSVMWDRGHMMYGRFNPWDKEFDGLHVINLNITIISGQYVCPSTYTGSPQVEVEVIGIPVDASRQKTKLVQRNSLNPIWNDLFHFKVTFSELAFLRFSVIDVGTSHVTSQRVIPLKCLKQGYRQVRLRSPQNQPLYLSTLFIHSAWEEEGLELPGDKEEQPGSGKKVKNKVKETLSADSGKNDLKEVTSIGSAPVKRRMFFLMVHGVQSEKSSTILKITQESTTQEVIGQALTKANKSHESVNDYVLIEEVQRGWDKRQSEKSTSQRFLDPNERPLEAQAHWQGEGRFILKKLSDDPSTRAWVTTIRSSSKKEQKRRDTELTDELHDWGETEEMFLVCVYNVSPEQPYAILKAPITSTSQDIIAQVLVKARRMEDPASFVLVEQVEYPPLDDGSLSGPVRRQGMQKNLRVLSDNENVYKAQARWKAKGWFELKKRDEALHVKKKNVRTKSGSLSRLGRLRSSSRTKDSEKSSPRHLPLSSERHIKSMNDSGTSKEDVDYKPPKRVVHSEGETISDDDECKDGISSMSKFKRISFRKLKAWR